MAKYMSKKNEQCHTIIRVHEITKKLLLKPTPELFYNVK